MLFPFFQLLHLAPTVHNPHVCINSLSLISRDSRIPRNSGTNFKLEGENVTGSRYITHLYCLAVQAGFYSNVVECWPVTQTARVRTPIGKNVISILSTVTLLKNYKSFGFIIIIIIIIISRYSHLDSDWVTFLCQNKLRKDPDNAAHLRSLIRTFSVLGVIPPNAIFLLWSSEHKQLTIAQINMADRKSAALALKGLREYTDWCGRLLFAYGVKARFL